MRFPPAKFGQMRFPSVTALLHRAYAVLLRFPWTLAAAATAAAVAFIGIGLHDPGDEWVRGAMSAMLAVPLSATVAFAAERWRWRVPLSIALQLAGLAIVTGFYLTWRGPDDQWEMVRYLQFSAALHLLVAVAPFVRGAETVSFWEYNRQLLLAFLRAAFFSAVLFVGLAVALGALDKLFGIHVPPNTYLRLWVVIALLLNTWIFLSGLSDDVTALSDSQSYPRALKIFTQFILTPLVSVYLVMLTAYLAKILLTRQWPSGWIGWLVGSVSVAGILGFLLVHPLRRRRDEGWIGIYARWLFVGLIPAALMLVVALAKRIGPYGLTELRVIALSLAVWLLAIGLLYTLRRDTGIRTIPLSLAALLLVLLAGPMSATALSVRSQTRRLVRMLRVLAEAPPPDANPDVRRETSAAVRYLLARHAGGPLQAVFGRTVAFDDRRMCCDHADTVATGLLATKSIAYVRDGGGPGGRFRYAQRPALPVETSGFDWMVDVASRDTGTVVLGTDTLGFRTDSASGALVVAARSGRMLHFDLASAFAALGAEPNSQPDWRSGQMRLRAEDGGLRGLLVLTSISQSGDSSKGRAWGGHLFVVMAPDTAGR